MKGKNRKASRPPQPWKRLLGFGLFILFCLLLSVGLNVSSQTKIVAYSEFKEAIRNNEVASVSIGQEFVEAKLKSSADARLLAFRVDDKDLVSLLEQKDIRYEAKAETSWLRDFFLTWVLPFIFIFIVWQFVLGKVFKQGGPPSLMAFGKSRAKLVAESGNKTTFKDVAGCDEAKEELAEIIDFLKAPQKFRDIGGRIPKGVLLVGPPGTGKTLLARAVAGEAGVAFFQISGSDFVEMFVGVGAARVRDLFAEAAKRSPCIVFIDELDAIAKSRGGNYMPTNDEREQTLNQILVEMDGFDNHSGVILMAATNRPEVLDPAILRPGRFDRQIVVDRPDVKGREEILRVHARGVKMDPSIDFKTIASRTPGISGADLANIVNEAALLAVRKGQTVVTKDCFEDAIDRVVAGLARKNRVISEQEKRTIAIHEVGHALVARYTPGADKVHRISIIPRTSGALGFTLQVPAEDRHLLTKGQLKNLIRVLLGGRAAEKIIIGEVTAGAQDDLRRASDIVRRMIGEFGMSESLGLVSLGQHGPGYLANPFVRGEWTEISDETARKIDQECRDVLDAEFENASHIIRSQRPLFDSLVALLLDKETLEFEDFDRLVAEHEAAV